MSGQALIMSQAGNSDVSSGGQGDIERHMMSSCDVIDHKAMML